MEYDVALYLNDIPSCSLFCFLGNIFCRSYNTVFSNDLAVLFNEKYLTEMVNYLAYFLFLAT